MVQKQEPSLFRGVNPPEHFLSCVYIPCCFVVNDGTATCLTFSFLFVFLKEKSRCAFHEGFSLSVRPSAVGSPPESPSPV
jgi:hypothetical protein